MPSYNSTELHLRLSDSHTQTLNGLYKAFAQCVEDKKVVDPALISRLTQTLEEALATHKTWQGCLSDAQSFRHSMLHLLHNDQNVLALPWHIVPSHNAFIHLSKGFGTEGGLCRRLNPKKLCL